MQGSCGSQGTGSIYLPFPHAKRLNSATVIFTHRAVIPLDPGAREPTVSSVCCILLPRATAAQEGNRLELSRSTAPAAQCHQAEMVAQEHAKVVVPV